MLPLVFRSFICSMMIFCNYIQYFIKFILRVFIFSCLILSFLCIFSAKIILLLLLYHYRVRAPTTYLNIHTYTYTYMCISAGDSETGENSSLRSYASAQDAFATAAAECDFMAPAFYHCLIHFCHLSNYYFHHLLLLVLLLCLRCYCRGNYFATILTTTIHYSVYTAYPLLFGAAVIHTFILVNLPAA